MKEMFWKLCVLTIGLTMLLTVGAFAEGSIGLGALGLYGVSTVCGIQWACAKVQQAQAQPREPRRAPGGAGAAQQSGTENPLQIA